MMPLYYITAHTSFHRRSIPRPTVELTSSSTDREIVAWLAYRLDRDERSFNCQYSNEGYLVGMSLGLSPDTHQFPEELGKLKHLRWLSMTGDRELKQLPLGIEQLTTLDQLEIKGSGLTGLPAEIGQLTNLTELVVTNTRLTSLPSAIGQLTLLHRLRIKYNSVLTHLPPEIGRLHNMDQLHLSYNQISELPAEIGQLANLRYLDLSYNSLTRLPSEIGRLPGLVSLALDYNQLSELPPEIGQLSNLESLGLANNQLAALPMELAGLTRLHPLNLHGNPVDNLPLPPELALLTRKGFATGAYLNFAVREYRGMNGQIQEPLRVLYDEVYVDYGQFVLFDSSGELHADQTGAIPDLVWIVDQGINFRSAVQYHYAWVRMEAWEHEPPPPLPGLWETNCELTFVSPSGSVGLSSLMGASSTSLFTLGEPGRKYRLRAYCRGRKAAVEAFERTAGSSIRGIEQYLLQFYAVS